MKKIIKIITLFIACNTINAQQVKDLIYENSDPEPTEFSPVIYYKDINNFFAPFIGDWKYVNGNRTFIVTFWKETKIPFPSIDPVKYFDGIRGHYIMYQDYGLSTQQIVYTSHINIAQSITPWPYVIYAESITANEMGGFIYDINTEPTTSRYMPLRGFLGIDIIPNSISLAAHWKVDLPEGIRGTDQNIFFVIPTDVILTKI